MKRYFFEISYRGTNFYGWQRQPREISIQEEIENSLSKLFSNRPISVLGCGRTDTGVHAKQFFFHAELVEIDSKTQFMFKLNRLLPDSIVVHNIEEVSIDKHARFDAKERTYRYFIHQKKDAFINSISWYLPQKLNFEKMNDAALVLIGTKDFTSLSKLHTDVKTNICTITKAKWTQHSDNEWFFEISADRFLRNMVRATVGTLIEVGLEKIEPSAIHGIIEAKDRQAAFTSVPAHGLFLWEITY